MRCDVMLTFSLPSRSTSLITQVQTVIGVIGSLEKHVERQQSENTEAAVSAAASGPVKEQDNEEELNVEESSGGRDDLVQPVNDGAGDDRIESPALPATATSVPTSEVAGGKKRSREAKSSTRNERVQTRSKKRAKLPHSTSTVHATSEEAGTTAHPRVVRRSGRRAMTKARKGTFEGTRRGIEADEEADDDFTPVVEEDGPPVDDVHDDHDEDVNMSMLAERAQQGRAAIKSFDERFKDLMGYKEKAGHCNVSSK